jgi:cyclophilin family peptidyl-prolyl cis-trans isomerase
MLTVALPSPGPQTALAGAPLNVALNGTDSLGNAVTYTVSAPSGWTATVMPQSNPTLTMTVTGTNSDGTAFSGNLVFSLFSNYVSSAVSAITSVVNSGDYAGKEFFRVIENFMAQAGSPTNNGQGGLGTQFDDDYNSNLQFTGPGLLALANGGPNTNNSQFFITSPEETTPYTAGNFRYTIIGYLISGSTILSDIMKVPVTTNTTTGFPDPNNPVTITSATMGTDNQDAVLQITPPSGSTSSGTVTVTASSIENGTTQTAQTPITVDVQAGVTNPPYLTRPVSAITTSVGQSVSVTIPTTNVSGGAVTYVATPSNSTITASTPNSSGQFTLNPSTVAAGVYSVTEGVTATSPTGSENSSADSEDVPLYVDPAAPTGITYVPASGATSTTYTDLNNTSGKTLVFDVTGVTSGATVNVYSDGTLIGTGLASGTSVNVTTNGTVTLTAGAHSITATQTLESQPVSVGNTNTTTNLASTSSSALSLTVDTTPPSFTSTPITAATVNAAYSYQVTTATDSAGTVTYSLVSPVSGMTINSGTGLIQWTPSSSQGSTAAVDVKATDPAGNSADQTFTIAVTNTNQAPVLTAASPSLGSTDSNSPQVIALSSFINNGSGTTIISDQVAANPLGGIAVTAISGTGTWEYALSSGTAFQDIAPSSSTLSTSNALLLPKGSWLKFVPSGSAAGTATITYCAWDTTSGTAGGYASTTSNGGNTAFSTASDVATLNVTSVVDSVVLTAAHPSLGATTKSAATTIALSSFINGGGGTTSVSPTATAGIALVGTTGGGTWSYATSSGGSFTTISSSNAPSTSAPLLLGSGSQLKYTPAGSNSETPTITYYGWNGTTGTSGSTGSNLSASGATGGTTAYSLASDTASLTVNDAPTLTAASPSLGSTTGSTAKTVGLSSFINAGSGTTVIADVDSNATVGGIALTGTTGGGTWAYELSGSTTYINVGTVSTSSALLLPANASLRYTPNGVSETATITYCAWDQTSGTAGGTASTTTNGASTAFSSTSDTASLTVNDAPVLTAASPSLGSTAANLPKSISVASLVNNGSGTTTVTDANSNATLGGIALTGTTGKGTWAYELSGQTSFTNVGTVAPDQALLLPSTATLQYTPDGADAESPTITYRAWDQTTGVAGTTVNSTADGGTTAFSTATDTATLTVTAANHAPVLTPASPSLGQTAVSTAKTITVASFINNGLGTTTITDADSNAVVGGIALTGTTGDGTWAYELSGQTSFTNVSVSASAALLLPSTASLRYTPTSSQESATITYCAWDTTSGTAGSTADTTTNGGSTAFSSATDTATLTVGPYASVSGHVYLDPGNTGVWSSSSKGLGGVTIRLFVENGSSTFTEVAAQSPIQTSANGSYNFGSLPAGTYQIQEDPPPTFLDGKDTVGKISGSTSGSNPKADVLQFTVTAGQAGTGYNFALTQVVQQLRSVRLCLACAFLTTGTELMQSLETAPSVNLAGTAGSTATADFSTSLTSHGSAVDIASPSATITSHNTTSAATSTLASMTVTLSNPQDGSSETLQAVTTGTPITSSYAGDVLTLSGVADTSTYQKVLESITYKDSAASPTSGDRTLDVVVYDGILYSDEAVSTINVLPIGSGATTTTVTSSAGTIVYGQSVTLTATVAPSSGSATPTGTVTFTSGGSTLGTQTLNSSGVATLSSTALAAGSDTVTASYGGDSTYATGSGTLAETVNKASTSAALSESSTTAVYGQSVTLTATLSVTSPGSGTPTGTVTFLEGTTTLGTGTLNSSGVATLSTTALPVGSDSLTASYAGDTNFDSSTSSAQTETVSQAATTTAVSISPTSAVSGQSLTVTATVSASSPGSGTPTGTVTFVEGSTTLGAQTLASGVATLTTSALTEGSQTITASYSGDTNFTTSTGTGTETLGQAATTTVLASSATNATAGQSVTFTATVSATSPGSGTPSGTVTFLNGSTTLGTETLSGGAATVSTTLLAAGTHSITASYTGSTNFSSSTSSALTETITASGTTASTVTLSASPTTAVYGESVTLSAAVAPATGSGTPTGTVTFLEGSTTLGTQTLASGAASINVTTLPVGTDSITASYGGDTTYSGSTSTAVSESVGQAATSTTVSASAASAVTGQYVTFTAAVAVTSPGSGTPSGTVTFDDNGTSIGTGTLTSSGTATFTTSTLAAGSHSITASYPSSTNFGSSSSTALTETISAVGTTESETVLSTSGSPAVFGQPVTFTAAVSWSPESTSDTPTGSVTFFDGSTVLATVPVDTSTPTAPTATYTTSSLSLGTHSITATYSGDTNFASSNDNLSEVIDAVGTTASTTSLTASPNPATVGQSVTFTATVAPATGSGTPSGSVTFLNGTTTLGSGTLSSGVATFSTSSLSVGTYSITASYSGDTTYAVSTSTAVSEQITAATATATTTTLTTSSASAVYGQSVTLTATVSPTSGSGTPSGTVTFLDGSTTLGTSALSSGVATLNSTTLPVGTYSITASYSGDTTYAVSTSTGVSETVSQAATTATVSASDNPARSGQYLTLTATVGANSPSSATPTGTVTFDSDGASLGTGTLDSTGTATFTLTNLTQGVHSITAIYQGATDFSGSTSPALSETVAVNGFTATTTIVTASPSPTATVGQSVTFTVVVGDTISAGIPTGTVTFINGTTVLGEATVDPTSGIAVFSTSSLGVGTYTITAYYNGDSTYAASSDNLSEEIDAVGTVTGTTTTLSTSEDPALVNDQVTITATVSPTSGTGTPTGTVTFTDGSTTLGTSALDYGSATFSTSALPLGSDTITASYGGDSAFSASSGSTTETVQESGTTTTLSGSPSSSVYGQSVALTATVTLNTSSPDTLSGTVDFLSGGATLGSAALNSSGVATLTTTALPAGTDSITASYEGNVYFGGSASNLLSESVAQAATSTSLSASSTTAVTQQYVTFTAAVAVTSPGSGTPTGTVTFMNGSSTLGSGTLDSSDVATFSTTFSATGSHSITAVYSGDTDFNTSTSTALTETISPVGTTTTTTAVTASPNPVTVGQSVTFTAQVSTGSGTPTGMVTFLQGSTVLGMGAVDPTSGIATFSTSSLSVGTNVPITALYSGDTTYAASAQNVLVTINAATGSPFSPASVDAALTQETNWLQP